MTPQGHCTVVGSEKLPVSSGLICNEIDRAIALRTPNVRYSVEIRVISDARLTARLIVEGRSLPLQNFAVMDGKLNEGTTKRFATSLAAVVAEAAKA